MAIGAAIPVACDSETPRRGDRTSERILDAAEELFAENGFSGTRLRDVAERVGIRIPSLYNHFASKEALYAEVLARGIGPLLETLSGFVAEGPANGRDPFPMVEQVFSMLAARPHLPRLIQHEALSGGERLTPALRDWMKPILAHAQDLIESHPSARRWTTEQIPLLVLALYNMVIGYFTVAPLYRALHGTDLLSRGWIEQQTRLLGELVAILFPVNLPQEQNPRARS